MHASAEETTLRPELRKVCALFLAAGVLFLPLILNPVTIGIFSKRDAERLAHVEDNWSVIRLLFTGMGIADIGLGVALWLWGKHVQRIHADGQARAAGIAATLGLIGGAISLITRW